jgi:LPS-assembly protein
MNVRTWTKKMKPFRNEAWLCLFALFAFWLSAKPEVWAQTATQLRTEIPQKDGSVVVLIADDLLQKIKTLYTAKGHVLITYKDIVMSGDEVHYDENTGEGDASGHIRFTQNKQWLTASKAEFNFFTETGVFYDASGYTDTEFSVLGRTIWKTGPDTYRMDDSVVTTCGLKNPKWSFSSSRVDIRIDGAARLRNTVFKIKGIPVFYAPYFIVPLEKKQRSSGFIPFHTGTSTSKGRLFSEGYYQTLGPSADILLYGDYFTLRGLGVGGRFRTRPNPNTHFTVEAYGISDKLNQGGVRLVVDGESLLKDDWRAVARVNITSNSIFRQVFSDSFSAATVSQEHALAFLNRNHNSFSANIAFQRDEVLSTKIIIKKVPSLEFESLGTPLGKSPLILSFRTALDGVSRLDGATETPALVQRLDFFPRLTLRLPSLMGFSLIPSVGVRETYYGARMSSDSLAGVSNQSLNRQYAELNLDLRMPVLEKDFSSGFRHTVEPYANYRRISGIKNFNEIIRFDEQDAISNTNEIEYGIVNRLFKQRKTGAGAQERYQYLSFSLAQKYYFDPSFGGAFHPGVPNSFYPLDSITGLYQTGILRNFSPISASIQATPRGGIQYDFRADYDPKFQYWRNESLSAIWQRGKYSFSGTYFRANPPAEEPSKILRGDAIQTQISYGAGNRGFFTSLGLSYNLQSSELLNSLTRVSYLWDCCGISTEFNQYSLGFRTESRFSFTFMLKGIGSFGNIKRPENPF